MRRAVLFLVIWLLFVTTSPAQTFTKLHDFQGSSDGAQPYSSLIQGADGYLYGETQSGGSHSRGTIFKVTPDGTLTTIRSFIGGSLDGIGPFGGLASGSDGNFYGTALGGGTYSNGTVFKITPQGTTTVLHNFCPQSPCEDGAEPTAGLILGADGNFYGTTNIGSNSPFNLYGTVFKITPDGSFTTLHKFNGTDGANVTTRLLLARDGNFYGTTQAGGYVQGFRCPEGCGTVFRITPQGTFTTLHTFCSDDSSCPDGTFPYSGFVQGTDGALYGTTAYGGATNAGTIYKITLDGILTTIYSFPGTQSWQPAGELIEAADAFYGMSAGGQSEGGTIYRITPGGSFTVLHGFCPQSPCSDGSIPGGALLIGADGLLYGTASRGGSKNQGTFFSLDLGLAPLSVTKAGTGTVISTDVHINCGPTCSYTYAKGKQVELSPIPGPGSTFSGWTGCDKVQNNFCIVSLNSARNISATFSTSSVTLTSLVMNPPKVKGGQLSAGTLTLSGPAPDGGLGVSIASGTPSVAHPPAWIVVAGGQTTAGFAVRTLPVKSTTLATISASTGTSQATAILTVINGRSSQPSAGRFNQNRIGGDAVHSKSASSSPTDSNTIR